MSAHNERAYTSGPWTVDKWGHIRSSDGEILRVPGVALPGGAPSHRDGEYTANAKLIAAAPELAEAQQRAIDRLENLISAMSLKDLPAQTHLDALRGLLPEIAGELAIALKKAGLR